MNADRETLKLGYHSKYPKILCGLDKETGTSWLALNTCTGDFAMVINFRTPNNKQKKNYTSRGTMILEYVKINDPSIEDKDKMYKSTTEYEEKSFATGIHYQGYALVFGNVHKRIFKYH
jgi:uncharacterized protein with NRDE domain